MPDYSVRLELQRLRDEHVVLMAEHRYLIESRASVLAPEHLARLDATSSGWKASVAAVMSLA